MSASGDFLDILKKEGYRFPGTDLQARVDAGSSIPFEPTEGTTILAVRCKNGVLIAGDRRATAGTTVIYDRADKVIDIDEYSVMAISGSPAIAYEIARILEHSFQYHRRRQLQEMSLEAKLRRLSLLIRDNLPMAIQGIGGVIPIMAVYDVVDDCGKIFFYDALGAEFESADFATTGSGSPAIRGLMYYLNQWGDSPFAELSREEGLGLVLRMLHTAAEYDAATGRYARTGDVLPTVKIITSDGLADVSTEELRELHEQYIPQGGEG